MIVIIIYKLHSRMAILRLIAQIYNTYFIQTIQLTNHNRLHIRMISSSIINYIPTPLISNRICEFLPVVCH